MKVYDGSKIAELPPMWVQLENQTLEQAKIYAKAWLGDYKDVIPEDWDGSPIDYNGFGDMVEIREENNVMKQAEMFDSHTQHLKPS
jgi:hypothetical protein